jgi:glycosyltransferase involved in cell wall biosynthesis
MHIGVNTIPLYPSQIGGMEMYTTNLLVLCSKVASIPEVVGDAALLFDPSDPEEMADSMHRILSDEELRRTLVKAGRERAPQFSWERTARETLKVLEEAASIGTHHSHTHR